MQVAAGGRGLLDSPSYPMRPLLSASGEWIASGGRKMDITTIIIKKNFMQVLSIFLPPPALSSVFPPLLIVIFVPYSLTCTFMSCECTQVYESI